MKVVQKISSVFLAMLFLVSSLGFTVNKMVCIKSGKTKLSLVQMKDCCPENSSSIPVIKSNCCDITNTSFNLGDFQFSTKQEISSQSYCLIPGYIYFPQQSICPEQSLVYSFADLPPPRSGRSLLNFISILII
jgi:hypothetical protein